MTKFKIGDRVRIKPNANKICTSLYFLNEMKEFLGKETTIMNIREHTGYYELENVTFTDFQGEEYYWLWDEDWLEPVYESPIKEFTEEEFMSLIGGII